MSKKDFPLPNQIAWNGICNLQQAREAVRSQLVIAEDDLKDARRNLADVGKDEKSEEFRDAAALFVKAEAERDYRKSRLVELARDIDAAIVAACKGEGKLFDDLDVTIYTKAPTTEQLYGKAESEDANQQKLPVGRKPGKTKPEQPDPSKGDGVDEHLNASVNELDVSDSVKRQITGAGFLKIGQVLKVFDTDGSDREVFNLSEKGVAALEKSCKAYRKKHNLAIIHVERDED